MGDEFYFLYDNTGKQVLNLCEMFLDDKYEAPFHNHHTLEISYIKTGKGTYCINESKYDLIAGDVMIISNTENHKIIIDKDNYLVNTVIHFEPEFVWNNLNNDMDYRFLQMFYEKGDGKFNRLDRDNPVTSQISNDLASIQTEFRYKRQAYELMIKAKFLTVFANIIRYYDYTSGIKLNPILRKDMSHMNRVLEYINNNLNNDIKLDDLSDIACMSRTYFCAIFKKFNGLSPFEYILSKRIQKAIEYIKTTEKSITEISSLCGFNTSANFNKTFKKITGNSPSYYRLKDIY